MDILKLSQIVVVYLSKVFWYIARIVIRKLSIPTTTVSISDILS